MGACSSVDRDADPCIRYRLAVSYKGRRISVSWPAKEKPLDGEKPVGGYGPEVPAHVVKDEVFFDSCAWLDSDCEDFFSVNGEFTPQGSTPIHQLSVPMTPREFSDSKSEPSPTGRKKLGELFRETSQVESEDGVPNAHNAVVKKLDCDTADTRQLQGSSTGALYLSENTLFNSKEAMPNKDSKIRKDKIWKTQQCCLPSLHTFGIDDRRSKINSGPCIA
ncbi:uncharacterized protein At3g27210-like [Zingiber officinale]|uniref:uncharacterized protein At3g27210-like n=1 Tax=Zingiber officinale TaxID=94328 RepID=UPI001C4D3590|nr:uncharacterized protein At3g27210-like [Zingiber officinale]XP_042463931.1 uncharacterized protein At3g27210-like [Zingiber officinale]